MKGRLAEGGGKGRGWKGEGRWVGWRRHSDDVEDEVEGRGSEERVLGMPGGAGCHYHECRYHER